MSRVDGGFGQAVELRVVVTKLRNATMESFLACI